MINQIFSIFLAVIGIGVLIFLHELGHYFMALKRGMRVEVFSIGFGRPIYFWYRGKVKWQIGSLPFGGYVKIAGMQKEGGFEPEEIEGGFFAKKPIDRLLVAFSGPFANILFALLIFTFLWSVGGRESFLSYHTQYIGWIDPSSAIYKNALRPGDRILYYDGQPFHQWNDLLYASALKRSEIKIEAEKFYRFSNRKEILDRRFSTYQDARMIDGIKTIGLFSPASYLLYLPPKNGLSPISPLNQSGIQEGDRIVWVDGSLVFSVQQLSYLINDPSVFLTVQRGKTIFHARVPRMALLSLHLSPKEKAEIDDWRFEASLKKKLDELYVIPYLLNSETVVESPLTEEYVGFDERNPYALPLLKKDRILAVDGEKVSSRKEFLQKIQRHQALVIVERKAHPMISWKSADECFENFVSIDDLRTIVSSVGRKNPILSSGSLYLLHPIVPSTPKEMAEKGDEETAKRLQLVQKEIEAMRDGAQKQMALQEMEKERSKLVLGAPIQDLRVKYNPTPLALFYKSTMEIYKTLSSLIRGQLHPKWLAGPLGIVQIVQKSWEAGVKETLYWFGVISLNLGFINLLPLPVLDGGYILLSLFEIVTKKRLKPKTLDRLIFPFFVLLILVFVFIMYQDIIRVFGKYLHF